MKRFAIAIVAGLLTAAVVGGTAGASGEAITYRGFACNVFTASGTLTTTTNSVETVYASGKVVLQCWAQVGNTTGQAVQFTYENTGVSCGFFSGGSTTEWKNRVGAGGLSQLTCETWRKDQVLDAASSSAGIG